MESVPAGQYTPNKVKLGELLVDAGIVTFGDLTEAIQVSRRLSVPIGRVLLVSGCVTEYLLEAALEAQPLVKDGTITRESAVEALRKAYLEGSAREKPIDVDQISEDGQALTKRLAELLIDSEIVTQEQLDQAMETSYSTGMPLGSALVLEGVLSPALFPSILRIQRNIREGRLSRQEGIDEIKSTFLHWMKAEESLSKSFIEDELLDLRLSPEAGLDQEFLGAFADRFTDRYELPPPAVLAEPLEMASASPQPEPIKAEEKQAYFEKQPELEKPVEQIPVPEASAVDNGPQAPAPDTVTMDHIQSSRLIDLLVEAGCFKPGSMQPALSRLLEDPQKSVRLFLLLDLIDGETAKAAMRSHELLEKKMINRHEASAAIAETIGKKADNGAPQTDQRMRRYYDPEWRKQTKKKILGGMVIGAALGALSLLNRRDKD